MFQINAAALRSNACASRLFHGRVLRLDAAEVRLAVNCIRLCFWRHRALDEQPDDETLPRGLYQEVVLEPMNSPLWTDSHCGRPHSGLVIALPSPVVSRVVKHSPVKIRPHYKIKIYTAKYRLTKRCLVAPRPERWRMLATRRPSHAHRLKRF